MTCLVRNILSANILYIAIYSLGGRSSPLLVFQFYRNKLWVWITIIGASSKALVSAWNVSFVNCKSLSIDISAKRINVDVQISWYRIGEILPVHLINILWNMQGKIELQSPFRATNATPEKCSWVLRLIIKPEPRSNVIFKSCSLIRNSSEKISAMDWIENLLAATVLLTWSWCFSLAEHRWVLVNQAEIDARYLCYLTNDKLCWSATVQFKFTPARTGS